MFSCDFEQTTGSYNETFGVAFEADDGSLFIRSDNGEIIVPDESLTTILDGGDRVWISYTIKSSDEQTKTLHVRPYRVLSVAIANLSRESTATTDDGVDLREVWIAQNFLTFDFHVRAKDQNAIKNHQYILIQKSIINDTLNIKFIHDAQANTGTLSCRTAVALNLDDLPAQSKILTLAIEYKDLLDGTLKMVYRNLLIKDKNIYNDN
jgi:hypothetical protein